MLSLPSQAATSGGRAQASSSGVRSGDSTVRHPGYYDARRLAGTALVKSNRQEVTSRTKADAAYYRSLGTQAVVNMDPLTHTVRDFGRLDGYLTGRSSAPARSVALGYVRSHLGALGLKTADLSTLRFRQDYVDASGVHNLSWTQSVAGATVFGNGLKVKVTTDGRVLAVQGSPVSGLAGLAAAAPTGIKVGASAARDAAARNVHSTAVRSSVSSTRSGSSAATVWSNHDYAKRVWFLTPQGLRPGWSTFTQTSKGAFQHVVDAVSGKVLFRHSNSEYAAGDALVYDNYPGAAHGGTARVVNLVKKGWVAANAPWLQGSNTWAWSDLNDDNFPNAGEKTPVPGTKHKAQFSLTPFNSSTLCSAKFVCTWDPNTAFSWRKNRKADVTQAFYLASNFHDYLAKAPISFTKKAGNFSLSGGDPVLLNALDGADTNAGLPDGNHIDNANMSTPPDGTPPTMQMYLWHFPGADDTQDPFVPTSSAFDASVEYHEYTHGLSNRLVIDANGNSTLNDIQAGAMGEAWSDYYAMDYLVTKGFDKDTNASGEVLEGKYLLANKAPFRTMAIDCAVGQNVKNCQNPGVKNGGYTYGDFPAIGGGPEVHSSGEVWAQTLWDIRKALGHKVADAVITRGMSLAADDPSMLDMRDAIIRADLVKYDRAHTTTLWKIFAKRGMGFFAGAIDAADTTPGEDFHTPPPVSTPHDGVVAGTVTDPTTGQPVQGAVVQVTGQGDQYTTTTDADGKYAIFNLVVGTYAKVAASGPGYIGDAKPGTAVSIGAFDPATDATDFQIIRDWAATSGGAGVDDFNGPDFTQFGCGPAGALDLSLSSGWGSTTGDDAGDPTNVFVPKFLTVKLPQPIDIDSFGVDPTATCGDGGSASTGDYKIETSADGVTFEDAADGTFTVADRGQLNTVTLNPGTGTGVQYVRFNILGNQTPDFTNNCPDGAFSGCSFTDLTELAVFGAPAAP